MKYKLNTFPFLGAILLAAILLFFRKPVSQLLDTALVTPLFSSFEGGVWPDLFFIFILLAALVWIAKEQSLKFLIKVVAFGWLVYLFQRTNTYWSFTKMTVLPELNYWDMVAISSLLIMPLYFLFHITGKKEEDKPKGNGFFEDNTVTNYEDDHFKRKIAATEIAGLIQGTDNIKSFAIGILGQYGSGKTSFLNLINLALKDTDVLKISFDPWSAANPEMIRREFFDLLSDKVAAVDLKTSSLIYSYGRKLASFDGRSASWFNWIGFLRNQGSVQSSGEYYQINRMLSATGRKVIVTIDDLDRLYPAEIIEVLKLIRNTANFSNVFYLVGYDREYVQSAIGTLNGSASDYLDKIFQLEIPLPKREEDDLLVTLKNSLKEMVSEAHYSVFENAMIPNGFRSRYEKAYSGILRQGRDVVRFLNNFKIAYKLIGEEVDFECLLLLELIKFRFPSIYDLIYTQSDSFLYESPVRSTHEQYYAPRLTKSKDFINHTDEISAFRTHLEKLELVDEDVSLLDGLFMTLFKGSQYYRPESKNSISYPLYFEIYFRYRLSQTDLSDKDYQAAKSADRMREYMQYCANNNLHKELMTRLMQEDTAKDRRRFEQVVRWIFSFGRTFVEKEGKFRFDFESFVDKISNYHGKITEKFYKKNPESYSEFIGHLLGSAMAPFLFENQLIYQLKKQGGDFVISASELTAHQLSYFTQLAESTWGLSEDVLWIYWGARQYYEVPVGSSGGYHEHWRFEPELVKRMKVYLVSKDPKEFLKFSIQREMQDRSLTSIYKHVMDMYDDPSEYRKLVAENPELREDVRTEYLDLFDKLAAKNFTEYVEMEFKSELHKPENP
ncbi:P-loop NTPase fold protein [Pedobacter antarcticus]|uniref:KAP family P-loop NTPase fold protein n=1 Tax=Pedobacter antarcticus TaxID=34086 RepID=UPI00292DF087|nr:P-loop NTPase fold protein [Pedobacter antarcticus]